MALDIALGEDLELGLHLSVADFILQLTCVTSLVTHVFHSGAEIASALPSTTAKHHAKHSSPGTLRISFRAGQGACWVEWLRPPFHFFQACGTCIHGSL